MVSPHELATGAYESIYTDEHLVVIDGKARLRVELGGKLFGLPMVNVTPQNETSLSIAWFDPSPDTNPQLSDAAAREMSALLSTLEPGVVVMPASSKSEAFIRQAVGSLPDVILVRLLGGKRDTHHEELLKMESDEQLVTYYTPVTRVDKIMGLAVKDAPILRHRVHQKRRIVFADDVLSTGETIEGMKRTLAPICGDTHKYTVAVIAQEALLTKNYPPPLGEGVHALIAIPEIPGLDPKSLFPVTERESIPPAMLL